MIRNENFIKRQIGSGFAIVAVGEATKQFNGMISVNETGSFIWDCLAESLTLDALTEKITEHYGIDAQTAKKDAIAFLDVLKGVGAVAD